MVEEQVLRIMGKVANSCFDWNLTILKFSSNWRVAFGPHPESRKEIDGMAEGTTLMDAFVNAMGKEMRRKC